MRKSLWWIFLLCSLIFSVVIYWQWTEFTVGSTYREINNIEQQIEIKQRADRLLISHTFYNVDGEDITVRYPKSATNFRCGNKQSRKCPQTLNIDHDNVNFRYEIQFDRSSKYIDFARLVCYFRENEDISDNDSYCC